MTSIRALLPSLGLCFVTLDLTAAESPPLAPATLTIERGAGPAVKVIFPSVANQRYQVYVSRDLREWEFFGDVIKGNVGTITVEYNAPKEQRIFFRVEARPTFMPVSSRLERGANGEIKLGFPTVRGRKYLVYSTIDLRRWDLFSDLIDGTGDLVTGEIDPFDATEAFFLVEAVDVLPLPYMVWIKPGTFTMGSPLDEKDRDLDEDPLTRVILTGGFWMGKYEVTQREYEKVMGNNPSWFRGDPSRPVEQVSWDDAVAYCTRLTQTEFVAGRLPLGYHYRLPTEAEFEYACRAGTTTRFSFGDDLDYSQLGDYAWYSANSGATSHPVGQKKPNLFGLYDIYGNVWEWCLDLYQDRYRGDTVTDPAGPATGITRVFRGGGSDIAAKYCRSAFRNNVLPSRRDNFIGFRVVLATASP